MVALAEKGGPHKFLWVSSGEPHAIRRREILSKYGDQIRKLYGYDHATAYQVRRRRRRSPPSRQSPHVLGFCMRCTHWDAGRRRLCRLRVLSAWVCCSRSPSAPAGFGSKSRRHHPPDSPPFLSLHR